MGTVPRKKPASRETRNLAGKRRVFGRGYFHGKRCFQINSPFTRRLSGDNTDPAKWRQSGRTFNKGKEAVP